MTPLKIPPEIWACFAPDRPFRSLVEGDPLTYFNRPDVIQAAPSPYFDPAYYRAHNPDCPPDQPPLLHYLDRFLKGEERPAHPLFDATEYERAYPDLAAAQSATLVHFARHGDDEGRRPSRHFDAGFYRRAYMGLEERRPFHHYITQGRARGYFPTPPLREDGALRHALCQEITKAARPVVLISHEARPGGAPVQLLDLGRALMGRGWSPITMLIEGGPWVDRFAALGPCFNLTEGWGAKDLALLPPTPVLASTVISADLLTRFPAQATRMLLVQEMADYAHDQGVLPKIADAIADGVTAVFLRPQIAEDYRKRLPPSLPASGFQSALAGFVPQPAACSTRLFHARQKRGPHVIGGGYGDARKGFDRFIDTAILLNQSRPDIKWVWLGGMGEWGADLAAKARAQGVNLDLPGFVTDYPARLAAADVFLLTSRQDPGPLLVMESLIQGTGLVFFDGDLGIKDVIRQFGPMVQTPKEAAEAVTDALYTDTRAQRRHRRHAARRLNDFGAYADRIEELLGTEKNRPSLSAD